MLRSKLFWWGLVATLVAACARNFGGDGSVDEGGASGEGGAAPSLGGSNGGTSAKAGNNSVDSGGAGDLSGGEPGVGEAGASVGGNAVGGSAVGGSAVGGNAVGGSAVGGNAVGGNAIGGNAAGGAGNEVEVACPKDVQGHCSAGEEYPTYAGFTLALVEDFPVALDLDADPVFTWSDGGFYSAQTGFRRQNITFEDGQMVLVAESSCPPSTDNNQCYPARKSYAEALAPDAQANIQAMSVWSGELRSRYNNFRYGRYEVRMQAPAGNPDFPNDVYKSGNSITSMYVYRTPHNVQWNEIDANLEAWNRGVVGTDSINAASTVDYPLMHSAPAQVAIDGNIDDMHVYAFEWTPTTVKWFIDGRPARTYDGTVDDPIPALSAKIVMDLWVHSDKSYAGDAAYNVYPMAAHYDYFRFYRLDTESKYPCSPVPGCLDAADKTKSAQNNPNEVSYGQ